MNPPQISPEMQRAAAKMEATRQNQPPLKSEDFWRQVEAARVKESSLSAEAWRDGLKSTEPVSTPTGI